MATTAAALCISPSSALQGVGISSKLASVKAGKVHSGAKKQVAHQI